MSSAFKNFFITFAICLLIFGFLGITLVYEELKVLIMGDGTEESTTSDTSDSETSDTVSKDESDAVISDYDENGDIFTAVIMCVDDDNRTVNCVFVDANGKTKQYLRCVIPANARVTNEVGELVPVSDLFALMTPEQICECVSAMTGIQTDYCIRFGKEDMLTLAQKIPGASITLQEDLYFTNPKYAGMIFSPDPVTGIVSYPEDYTISITNTDGKVLLATPHGEKTNLEWLLEYIPAGYSPEAGEYTEYYSQIAKALFEQFFIQEHATKTSEILATIISISDTNLSLNDATSHLSTIFSHNDYNLHPKFTYPTNANWENAIKMLREADGRFNR